MKVSFQTIFFLFLPLFATVASHPLLAQTPSTGLGTYYADKYHGRPTASGELYDKFKFTAAHRTLPFGTMVKVTRLDNGRSVVVRVNDRGPFSQGRIIDVSRVAAEQLDMIRTGETQVRIEVVSGSAAGPVGTSASEATTFPTTSNPSRPSTTFNPDNRDLSSLPLRDFSGAPAGSATPTTSASTGSASQAPAQHPVMVDAEKYTPAFFQFVAFKREASGFGVQVGAYFSFYRLMEAMDQLAAKGIQNTMLHSSIKDGQPVFRILIGPFPTRDEAKDMQKKVKGQGVEGIVVNFADLR